ncbi:MAG: hypothetical protein IJ790_00755 [Lachnospiraceae bacterium]|nr:hypothetical protein [Lachnospiraceae bacterium]
MTNKDKMISIDSNEQLANFLADEIYSIFRFNITKKNFVADIIKWLEREHEEYGV